MNNERMETPLQELKKPFHPSHITWKPGVMSKDQTRALALPYADLRAYQNRLDEVCGMDWAVTYTPWGERLVCNLTIHGVTRSSTGEADSQAERSEISGTAAEAQAFKRACTMFGLGRYLYQLPSVWVDYDVTTKQFTAQAKAKLEGVIVLHYQRAMDDVTEDSAAEEETEDETLVALHQQFNALGQELYGEEWEQTSRHNVARITDGESNDPDDLSAEQLERLIEGMRQLKRQRSNQRNGRKAARQTA